VQTGWREMAKSIGIVGSGRVAGALNILLTGRGVRITRSSRRPAPEGFVIGEIARHAPITLIAVSDDAIEAVAHELAAAAVLPTVALHTSGAAGPDALKVLRQRGVSTGVLHPLQTIPSCEAGVAALPGSSFAFAGDLAAQEEARELIRLLEGKPLYIDPERWHFYHAAAVMASNYQVALIDAALELMEGAGVERAAALPAIAPLIGQSNRNILTLGPDAALTGPIRRGDSGTVLKHVTALRKAPERVRNLYSAAALQTLTVAERSGLAPGIVRELANAIAAASIQ
jgi:predicted short-subunit dehydrogenase-like oxidoreductase (DUF2520 family)